MLVIGTYMWITKSFTALLVALAGMMPSSCTKVKNSAAQSPTAQQVAGAREIISMSETNKNLGDLSLTNHFETCVDLGSGRSCTIKPTLMGHNNLQLTMAVESKNADGKIQDLSVVRVLAKAGKTFDVAVGDMNLTFTPMMSE